MTYYPRFSISADPMPSARPEWIGLQLTTGLWVSATFSCSGVGQGFCYGHPGGIRLIVILAQRETAELVSQGHLRWPPSVGQDWGAIRKTDPRKPSPFGATNSTPFVATRVRTPIVERRTTNHVLRRQDGIGGQAISLDVTFPHVG